MPDGCRLAPSPSPTAPNPRHGSQEHPRYHITSFDPWSYCVWREETTYLPECSNRDRSEFHGLRIIRHGCKDPSIRITMTASAGATIQGRIIGIIIRLASMTTNHDKPAKLFRQPDHTQSAFNKTRLLQWGETLVKCSRTFALSRLSSPEVSTGIYVATV